MNTGKSTSANEAPKNRLKKLSNRVSSQNCAMSCSRLAPITFRNPTSIALSEDSATDKAMKLQQAMSRISHASPPKV